MSAEENKAVLRRVFQEAFNEGKLEVIDETYSPEYQFDAPPLAGNTTSTNSGRDAFKQRVIAFSNAFGDIHYKVQDVIAEGDLVATRFIFGGIHRGEFAGFSPTGKRAEIMGIHFARFVDGKIQKTWAGFTNIAEALAA